MHFTAKPAPKREDKKGLGLSGGSAGKAKRLGESFAENEEIGILPFVACGGSEGFHVSGFLRVNGVIGTRHARRGERTKLDGVSGDLDGASKPVAGSVSRSAAGLRECERGFAIRHSGSSSYVNEDPLRALKRNSCRGGCRFGRRWFLRRRTTGNEAGSEENHR